MLHLVKVGHHPWAPACDLVAVAHCLPAHNVRHSFQTYMWSVTFNMARSQLEYMWNMTSDMTRRSSEIGL